MLAKILIQTFEDCIYTVFVNHMKMLLFLLLLKIKTNFAKLMSPNLNTINCLRTYIKKKTAVSILQAEIYHSCKLQVDYFSSYITIFKSKQNSYFC